MMYHQIWAVFEDEVNRSPPWPISGADERAWQGSFCLVFHSCQALCPAIQSRPQLNHSISARHTPAIEVAAPSLARARSGPTTTTNKSPA